MRIWIRWDPSREEAVAEDESGEEILSDLPFQRDGVFYLIGPLDIEDQ